MADENKPLTTIPAGTPININVSPSAPASPTAVVTATSETREQIENDILKNLGVKKSERARVLEELKAGRVKLAETKEVAAAANQAAAQIDAQAKVEAEALKSLNERVEALNSSLKKYADQEFASLPESFQKTITEMGLTDPQKQLDMINVFRRTGLLSAAAGAAAASVASSAAAPALAAAAPAAEAKKPSNTMATPPSVSSPPGATLNYYETWKAMTDRGEHWLAAQYLHAHQKKIIEQRPNR